MSNKALAAVAAGHISCWHLLEQHPPNRRARGLSDDQAELRGMYKTLLLTFALTLAALAKPVKVILDVPGMT